MILLSLRRLTHSIRPQDWGFGPKTENRGSPKSSLHCPSRHQRSGQGASLAIEDAVVLAKCLHDLPDIKQAFPGYERLRRGRAEKVVQYSARISRMKALGHVGRWFRDLFMPFALKHFASRAAHAWLYRYHVDWNEPV